jgi:hypothetical protein
LFSGGEVRPPGWLTGNTDVVLRILQGQLGTILRNAASPCGPGTLRNAEALHRVDARAGSLYCTSIGR